MGGVHRWGHFEIFPSGGVWAVLFGKPLLEAFGAWHGYEEDVSVLRDGGTTLYLATVTQVQERGDTSRASS